MARWAEVEAAAADLAAQVRERFDAHAHKVLARSAVTAPHA